MGTRLTKEVARIFNGKSVAIVAFNSRPTEKVRKYWKFTTSRHPPRPGQEGRSKRRGAIQKNILFGWSKQRSSVCDLFLSRCNVTNGPELEVRKDSRKSS